ncbi:hypothetical protein KTR66_09915 [Roseococcus sp. SDR]|uniref:phage holin family protein n=1 Tax=Roseococcus sp. SDR TaxID=2835532 RepID=UPI001BCAAAE9|nr:phage holin family protein [Roseococcus sp. SDR]MBS7790313.1 hypothetical protein [Roseococcus sp. SDR]MBV1845627.1 hypothetical protein [Roseococcus sp. SDR]
MPLMNPGPWGMLFELAMGAAAGIAGGFVRWNNPQRRRIGLCLLWELPSAALIGSAGYALAGLLELNDYGHFLFAFMFGYLGQAALHDLALAIIRSRGGIPGPIPDQPPGPGPPA